MSKSSERLLCFAPSCPQLAVSIRICLWGLNLKCDEAFRFHLWECESNKLFNLCVSSLD